MFRSREKDRGWSIVLLDFVVTFIIFYMASITAHEYFHANVARMLGYSPTVTYTWLGGLTYLSPVAGVEAFLIGIMGGLGVGLLYLGMSYFDVDVESTLALQAIGSLQIGYGICEGFWLAGVLPKHWLTIGAIVGPMAYLFTREIWIRSTQHEEVDECE